MYKPRVYTASKIWHAPLWRKLRQATEWQHVEFTARWPFMEHLETGGEPTPAQFAHFWTIDMQDVKRSDFVLLYAFDDRYHPIPDSDTLKGALVEAGMGIACGHTILTIGLAKSHSWAWHPRVIQLSSLQEARLFLLQYEVSPR